MGLTTKSEVKVEGTMDINKITFEIINKKNDDLDGLED
jgi:hypothetical protein